VLEGDAVDFVVDVEAFDVGSVVFHDHVDELVDGCWGVVVLVDDDFFVDLGEEEVVSE
jgi:hypothetical protein